VVRSGACYGDDGLLTGSASRGLRSCSGSSGSVQDRRDGGGGCIFVESGIL
jgi:hypothetical protein